MPSLASISQIERLQMMRIHVPSEEHVITFCTWWNLMSSTLTLAIKYSFYIWVYPIELRNQTEWRQKYEDNLMSCSRAAFHCSADGLIPAECSIMPQLTTNNSCIVSSGAWRGAWESEDKPSAGSVRVNINPIHNSNF